MKSKKLEQKSMTAPLIKELTDRQKANFKTQQPDPAIGAKPLNQPDLYQDSGGGYNPGFTFPQD